MNEKDWSLSTSPGPMLTFLLPKASPRKARLFGCAYLCQYWAALQGKEGSREAVVVAEKLADGKASKREVTQARRRALETAEYWSAPASGEEVWQAVALLDKDAHDFVTLAHYESTEEFAEPDICDPRKGATLKVILAERDAVWVKLLRDVFGPLPFRPVRVEPTWRSPTVVGLAEAIYQERLLPQGHFDNGRRAVLADALEEARCDNREVLGHPSRSCRSEQVSAGFGFRRGRLPHRGSDSRGSGRQYSGEQSGFIRH